MHAERTFARLLGCLMFWASAGAIAAATPENPYQSIVERNVFALKDPPLPPSPESQKAPPPKIALQGITSILGRQQVLFKVSLPAKPPEPAKEVPMILSVGQREGEIEVVEIDQKTQTIRFNNHGTMQLLSMDKDAAKPTAVASVPGIPTPGGGPGLPAIPMPAPAFNPSVSGGGSSLVNFGGSSGGLRSIPTRQTQLNSAGGVGMQAIGGAGLPQQTGYPQLTFGQQQQVSGRQQQFLGQDLPNGKPMTFEESEIMQAVNHQAAQSQGDPSAAFFPPTVLNPNLNTVPDNPTGTTTPPPAGTPPRPF